MVMAPRTASHGRGYTTQCMSAAAPDSEPPLIPSAGALRELRDTFGLPAFRPGQGEVVAAGEAGRDVLLVAPTGAGKSISYWVPGLLSGGLTLVVSPLIALMTDQLTRLRSLGIAAGAINSHVSRSEQMETRSAAAGGRLRFLYVAPERFAARGFGDLLADLRVSRFVVDEAHCISSWGHDFRPDYRRLGAAIDAAGRPPIGAFTATATPRVRDDIVSSLGMRDPVTRVTGFVRPELTLRVLRSQGGAAKLTALTAALRSGSRRPGEDRTIVYCGRTRGAEEVARHLRESGMAAAAYHGSLAAEERRRVQDGFAGGAIRIVAATSAFGMGIDLPDIRQVVHLDFPGSVESYYQECGRAGRDGLPATCTLIYNPADRDLQAFFIESAYPDRGVVRAVYRELLRDGGWQIDDWERRLPSVEPQLVRAALDVLGRAGVLLEGGGIRRLEGPPIDFQEQARLRENAYARLHQVMEYAQTRHCRHARIAGYFGEEGVAPSCESCDNCANPGSTVVVEVDRRHVVAALECVERFDGHLGTVRLATLLRGTRDSWAAARAWVQRLGFFGALSDWPLERVRDLLGELIARECLRRGSGERPTLALTPLGRRVLSGEEAMTIELAAIGPIRVVRPGGGAAATSLDAPGRRRFEELRTWRTAVARRDGVPAYAVFPDRTLQEIAASPPTTLSELAGVHGVGPAKLERHGAEVLGVLRGPRQLGVDGGSHHHDLAEEVDVGEHHEEEGEGLSIGGEAVGHGEVQGE